MEMSHLLGHFREVSTEADGGYLAACPAHGDSNPSLRIWLGDNGKVRLACRAGCPNDDVVRAAGLRWPQLFDVSGDGPVVRSDPPKLVTGAPLDALAQYVDRTVRNLVDSPDAAVAREYLWARFGMGPGRAEELGVGFDPGEGFTYTGLGFTAYPRVTVPLAGFDGVHRGLQGRDVSGECPYRWLSLTNPHGARWGLYGVFRGAPGSGVTVVTEGPGDGLTAVCQGFDAVVIRGAALSSNAALLAELADGLRGRKVVAAGDADAAGQQFNRRLADGLGAHGVDVYALTLPEVLVTDLTEWRAADPEFPSVVQKAVQDAPLLSPKPVQEGVIVNDLDKRTGVQTVTRDQGMEAKRLINQYADQYGRTDRGAGSDATNAYALVAWTDGSIKYAQGLGFYVWTGEVWERSTVRVRNRVHAMGAALMLAGATMEAAGFTFTSRIDSLMTELRSVPAVHADPDDFDAHPHLLCFRNGTVDLRTGGLRQHGKEDLITVMIDRYYRPHAQAPRWESFISEIMPEMPNMPDYLRRLIGYGITGNTSEQCFAVFFGKGANGKSVLCDTLADVFSEVVQDTPFATFEERASGSIPNDLAALRDARLVTASEGESGKPMSEGLIKKATGDKHMTARFMRAEYFTFTPRFLVVMSTNHRPQFRGQDEGLWRRVKLVPFRRYFAPEERDYNLQSTLLEEAEGIIAWAVRGAMEWFRGGLQDPEEIREATADYRATSNPLDGFAPGVYEVTRDTEHSVKGADVYLDYRDFCEAEGLQQKDIWKRPTLYRALEDLGAQKRKTEVGIKLFGMRRAEPSSGESGPGVFAA